MEMMSIMPPTWRSPRSYGSMRSALDDGSSTGECGQALGSAISIDCRGQPGKHSGPVTQVERVGHCCGYAMVGCNANDIE
jgi:hypothetical protein